MNRFAFLRLATAGTLLVLAGVPAGAEDIVPGHVLVRVRPGVRAETLAHGYGARVYDRVPRTDLYCLYLTRGGDPAAVARRMSADVRVVYAEPNHLLSVPEVSGNPFHWGFGRSRRGAGYAFQAAYPQVGVNLFAGGQVDPGSALTRVRGAGVLVAVVDTGVALSHPDLRNRLADGYNAITPGQAPEEAPDGRENRIVGHGTAIAGIIARLAPEARILPVRVLDGDGRGTVMNAAKGIQYAVAAGARVLNMSWGMRRPSRALEDALDQAGRAGLVLVASAGNGNSDRAQRPATDGGVIAVAAVEENNTKSPYSNFGPFVRVVAPGSGIRSTDWTGGYATWSGTSFAAPFVSAQAALLLSARPGLTGKAVTDLIRDAARSVDAQNPGYQGKLGQGIIDIEGSLRQLSRETPLARSPRPTTGEAGGGG